MLPVLRSVRVYPANALPIRVHSSLAFPRRYLSLQEKEHRFKVVNRVWCGERDIRTRRTTNHCTKTFVWWVNLLPYPLDAMTRADPMYVCCSTTLSKQRAAKHHLPVVVTLQLQPSSMHVSPDHRTGMHQRILAHDLGPLSVLVYVCLCVRVCVYLIYILLQ